MNGVLGRKAVTQEFYAWSRDFLYKRKTKEHSYICGASAMKISNPSANISY